MSSHVRNDRRPRFPRRQEWIPRTTTTATTDSSSNADVQANTRSIPVSNNGIVGAQRRHIQPVNHRRKEPNRVSELPQLVQEIQDKLLKGAIECMICYDMVKRSASIWSCSSCFSIFHLHCIKKWARAPTSIDLSAEKNQGFNWRCPGCQSVQLMSSKDIRYACFCGKRPDPPSDPYLTPHSCGEPCGRPLDPANSGSGVGSGSGFKHRDDNHNHNHNHNHNNLDVDDDVCPHRCVLQCHPGPCPPCKAFAPPKLCPCGKEFITTRCSDQKSNQTCGKPCGKLLKCLRHHCDKTCHVGPCDSCKLLITASCFCKRITKVVVCGDMTVKLKEHQVNVEDDEDGIFSCNLACGKTLACGNHVCEETCHPGVCKDCDLLPENVTSCYCGKSRLTDTRDSCLDPIPTCSQTCGKTLVCGLHGCKETCHPGSCAPCRVMVTQKCRCGSTHRSVECFKTTINSFTCEKPCGHKKNCGRHRCSDKCCPLSNPGLSSGSGLDPHLCSKPCEKKLRCGQHDCGLLCHSGHCPPCPERIFNDLTCACGRSSIPPPLPCGTPPPSCQYPCAVPQPCGHVSSHSCHFGECPPCSVPIPKECIGGHVVLRNIPCGSKDIRCNKLCGKTRQCGMHACLRTCHPAPCDSGGSGSVKASCGQTCGAPRRDCRHTCVSLCHPFGACPDVRCEFPVTITCGCGRITATVPCDAGGGGSGSVDSVLEIQKLAVPLVPVDKKTPLGQRKLACDDECARVERKKVLADAFGVTSLNLDTLHFGESSDVLGDLFRRDSKWVLAVEERCKMLVVGGGGRGGRGGVKVHVFCPMLKEKRDAVRLIAERWKLSISGAGWEPKRFIVVHATPKSKAPSRVIGAKGLQPHSLSFDPLVDMDPRLVVCLFDLPSDADVSALVLRFGGECELVWLNDKNALAVFGDPARAATAMRRLDHGSVYYGATSGTTSSSSSSSTTIASSSSSVWGNAANPWKKAVVQESTWGGVVADSNLQETVASSNRWNILEESDGSNLINQESSSNNGVESRQDDVVEDWEKAYND